MRRSILRGDLSFDSATWNDVSDGAKELIRLLLRRDPNRRLDPSQLLQHPWIVGTGVSEVPIRGSDINLKLFQGMRRKWSTALVVSMHKQAAIKKRNSERGGRQHAALLGKDRGRGAGASPTELVRSAYEELRFGATSAGATRAADESLMRKDSGGSGDVEARELLSDAFKVFDPEGKGYVLEKDLGGIIKQLGQQMTPDEVKQMISVLEGSASGNGTGKIHYQEYLRLASTTIKEHAQVFPTGTVIFREGDPSDYFYLITSGRVRRFTRKPPERFHDLVALAGQELSAGDYFGTSAILGSGERKRHSTMIAVTDVRVVRLGRDDFEAGHDLAPGRSPSEPLQVDFHSRRSSSTGRLRTSEGSDGGGSGGSRRSSNGGSKGFSGVETEGLSRARDLATAFSKTGSTAASTTSAAAATASNASRSKLPPSASGHHRDPSHTPANSLMPSRTTTASASRSAMRSLRFIRMMSNNEQRRYRRGDTLFHEGEDARHMYIITSGKVQVSGKGKDGRTHTIGIRGAGECCGETSCLSHKPRNSTCRPR